MMTPEERQERVTMLRIQYDYACRKYAAVKEELDDLRDELDKLGESP